MKPNEFIEKIDFPAIEAAITQAERKTSGEIRVAVVRRSVDDAVAAARKVFEDSEMHHTRARNGVLILVAPLSQKFAVIGDEGVHRKCGEVFWLELTEAMSAHFKAADFTAGLLHGVERAGELLAAHFPHNPDDPNELPNQVIVV